MRYDGELYQGTIPGAGSGVRDALYAKLIERMQAWDPDVAGVGWELYDDLGATDKVFRSFGDPNSTEGDFTVAYLRVYRTGSNIEVRLYSDWSTDSGTGSRENGGTGGRLEIASDTEACPYLIRVGSHEVVSLHRQASDTLGYKTLNFGVMTRDLVPSHMRGSALAGAASSGASVVLTLDRNLIRRIQVGQRIWLVHLTNEGDALVSNVVEVATVSAVGNGTITVATLATTIGVGGALVGLDPQPLAVMCNSGTNVEAYATGAWNPRVYMLHRPDGSYNSTTRATTNTNPESWIPASATPADVNVNGIPMIKQIYFNATDGLTFHPIVGGFRFLCVVHADVENAVRAEGDLIYGNGNNTAPWMVIRARLRSTTGSVHWNWALRYSTPIAA